MTLKSTCIACLFALAIGLAHATSFSTAPLRTEGIETKPRSQSHEGSRTDDATTGIISEDNRAVTTIEGRSPEPEILAGEVLIKFRKSKDASDLMLQRKTDRGFLHAENSSDLTSIFERFEVEEATQPFVFHRNSSLKDVLKLVASSLKQNQKETNRFISELRNQPGIEFAEPNIILRNTVEPNDTYFSSSGAWGQSFRDLWGLRNIDAELAWSTSTGQGVVVAVVDTGVDYDHPDISRNIWQNSGEVGTDAQGRDKRDNGIDDDGNGFIDDWRGFDFVTLDGTQSDNDPMDDNGHGSHVAGTVAATANNGIGVVGVAYNARIMAVKGIDQNGLGSLEDLIGGILYAADNGAKVINASWGNYSVQPSQLLIEAVEYANDVKGVVFIAAAGNDNRDVGTQEAGFLPANIRKAIAVSAFNSSDEKANFSNFGQKIDVAAPGGGDIDLASTVQAPQSSVLSILSSRAWAQFTQPPTLVVGSKYLRLAGTSMAAPHAAGAAALIMANRPELLPEQVRQALRAGSDDLNSAGFDVFAGQGRINVARSLNIASPLVASLTGPSATVTGTCSVRVKGTVEGVGLLSWRLEVGLGSNPTSWDTITVSSTQVSNGVLANWIVVGVKDGNYTLRLIAKNSANQEFEDRMVVKIDNVLITEPRAAAVSDETVVKAGTLMSIKGTASGCSFASYQIRIKRASTGEFLSSPAVTLPGNGQLPAVNSLLAEWDTTGIPHDRYQVILDVRQADGTSSQKSAKVIVDPNIHTGWPKTLTPESGIVPGSIRDHLTVADVNGDDGKDLVIGFGNSIRIYDHAGIMLPGWPRTIDPDNNGSIVLKSPAIGDLDGDSVPEIVTAATSIQTGAVSIFVWHADGTLLPGWPKAFGFHDASVVIGDIDGDLESEIVIGDLTTVGAIDSNGQFLPGWPKRLASSSAGLSPASIADMDGDGQKEVVIADRTNEKLFVLSSVGSPSPGWPKQIAIPNGAYPALGDLNGDGLLEIVIPSSDGKVYGFEYNGSNSSGWPQNTEANGLTSPAVGDIDGDGRAEVVVAGSKDPTCGCAKDFIYAWHGDGTLFPGWPVTNVNVPSTSSGPTSIGFGAVTLADVDGNGFSDVVVSTSAIARWDSIQGPASVKAFKYDGTAVAGFPKLTPALSAWLTNAVAVSDIDNDGLMEMAWIDRNANLFVWDLESPAAANSPWPMFRHDENHSGANRLAFGPSVSTGCPSMISLSPKIAAQGETVTLNGAGFSSSSAVEFQDGLNAPFHLFGDTHLTATVPPNAVGGTLTITKPGCTDRQSPKLTICPGPQTALSADNGSNSSGTSLGSNHYYVNRLTPAAYPATLSHVSVYFGTLFQNVPVGTPITVVAAHNPAGTGNIDNLVFQKISTAVRFPNRFNDYELTHPITIHSGDFVVGFAASGNSSGNTVALSPGPSNDRSYSSSDGRIFTIWPGSNFLARNFMLRAQVRVGACSPEQSSSTLSGRVMTPGGSGIRGATLLIRDSQGVTQRVTTNSFGLFNVENLRIEESYILSVNSKRYRFTQRFVTVNGNLTEVNFVGTE